VNGRKGIMTAGMNVTTDIRTDERRMIEYLLAPMLRYKQEALRER
jgi:hemolysin D